MTEIRKKAAFVKISILFDDYNLVKNDYKM